MADRYLRWLATVLRFEAVVLLSALFAILFPYDTMSTIHQKLGLGPLPHAPIVEYLTRSISALYAMWGPVYLFLARDIGRYLDLIVLLAQLKVAFGLFLLALDLWINLPGFWTMTEGPLVTAISCVAWWLARRSKQTASSLHAPREERRAPQK